MIDARFRKWENETNEHFQYRCSRAHELGLINTWNDVAAIVNEQCGTDIGECALRKRYKAYLDVSEIVNTDNAAGEQLLEELKNERRELEKEKVKLRDERNEVSRLYREQARNESYMELLERSIKKYEPRDIEVVNDAYKNGKASEVVVHLTDLHLGINVNSSMNTYNKNVAMVRLAKYCTRVLQIIERHDVAVAHIILGGDMISGVIHANLRLENNENVVQQAIDASEIVAAFIKAISNSVDIVNVYSVAGNHSRVMPNKAEHQKGENFDNFIPFYCKAKLQNYTNVKFYDNKIDDCIVSFRACGMLIYAVHGDLDSAANVVQNMTLMTGEKPDIIYMGHRHTNALTTVFDTKVIESGCVSGQDNYAIDHRLRNKPEQTVSVITGDGLECVYDIKL